MDTVPFVTHFTRPKSQSQSAHSVHKNIHLRWVAVFTVRIEPIMPIGMTSVRPQYDISTYSTYVPSSKSSISSSPSLTPFSSSSSMKRLSKL